MISPEQQKFLSDNRPHYDTLMKADFLTNISQGTKDQLLFVAQIFDPGYMANLWCGPCVCDLVKYVYTQYDKWRVSQGIQAAGFPAVELPKVKRPYNRKS